MRTQKEKPHQRIIVNAPLIKAAPLLSSFCEVKQLLVKDCSRTITGTAKDYRSAALLEDYGRSSPVFYSITYGNAGYSLGKLALEYNGLNGTDVQVVNVIDDEMRPGMRHLLGEVSHLVTVDLNRNFVSELQLLRLVRTQFTNRSFIHAEKGDLAYRVLVNEVLMEKPDYVVLPVGTGELLYNFFMGVISNEACRKTKIIAVTIGENVFAGWSGLLGHSVADKLITPFSLFFHRIKDNISHFGSLVVVDDKEILAAASASKAGGVEAEFSAATAFAGLKKIKVEDGAKIVVVNTGNGQAGA